MERNLIGKFIITQQVGKSLYFMEGEGSSSCSQELATTSYPEPDTSSPQFPTMPLRFSDQNLVRICQLSHECYMPQPSQP